MAQQLTDAEKIKILQEALAANLVPYLDGSHYDTINPYSRKYVKQGLRALAEVNGFSTFGSDWMDAMDKLQRLQKKEKEEGASES